MKALLFAAVLAVAPMTVACQSIPGVSQTADEKALLVVERGYSAAILSVNAAVSSGRLKGADAAKAAELLAKTRTQVQTARALYDAGQLIQSQAVVTGAQSSIAAINALTK